MKFVALLSGGKDSCFNVIKAIQYGHDLVCLANLAPPESFCGEDMDSFMYQTAGHSAVSKMDECFDVPLIRRSIMGTAVSQKLDYLSEVRDDEVEDMFMLLKEVKEKYPEVEGVSCGAIVSTYQRFRVESICQRLGLTVLSYLWQRDRLSLLQEMISAGVDAVLVKVAGAGLEPHKHLGKSLAVLQPTLLRLHERYGLDVCGEGGEYESLVLDCSAFKKRLVLHDTEVVIDEENYTVGYLKIGRSSCVPKDTPAGVEYQLNALADPDNELLSALEDTLLNASSPDNANISSFTDAVIVPDNNSAVSGIQPRSSSSKPCFCSPAGAVSLPRLSIGSDSYGQSSLVYPLIRVPVPVAHNNKEENASGGSNCNLSAAEHVQVQVQVQAQLADVMKRLQAALAQVGASLSDIVFAHLYIESSAVFKAVNDEYCRWFTHYPPSRSCVCVPLPEGVRVCMEVTFLKGSHRELLAATQAQHQRRQVLHVKSMSEWAPLCIGPYSQANSVHKSLIFVAGQIPLNPATMKLFDPSLCANLLSSDLHRAVRDILAQALHSSSFSTAAATTGSYAADPYHSVDSSALSDTDLLQTHRLEHAQEQLCTLAVNFLVQVTLCLRHAHRVLQAMNSSLSRTLCCTVYVSLPALCTLYDVQSGASSSASTGDLVGLISEEQLVGFVRRMIAVMDKADGAAAAGSRRAPDGDSDGDNESDLEDGMLDAKTPAPLCPVLVVSTSGLPRDALVEVEVVGFANNTIPPGAFLSSQCTAVPTTCADSAAVNCTAAVSAEVSDNVKKIGASLTAQVDAWPIWSTLPLPTSTSTAVGEEGSGLISTTEEIKPLHYKAQVMNTSLSRNLCMGFITISVHREMGSSSSQQGTELQVLHRHLSNEAAEQLLVNVDDAADLLVQEVHTLLRRAHLHPVYLRTLKVYYAQGSVVTEDLSAALNAQLGATLGLKKLSVLLVPMLALEMMSTRGCKVVLAAQVLAFDLAQLDTEEWVHVKER